MQISKSAPMLLIVCIFLVAFVAAGDAIGQRQDAQVDMPYIISQPCGTCTSINITVMNKEGVVLGNVPMVNNGSTWTFVFTPNETLRYDVNGLGDKTGGDPSFAFFFETTLSGEPTNPTIIISDIIILFTILGILGLLFYKHNTTEFDDWSAQIVSGHKHMGDTFAKSMVHTIFKHTFIWLYFIGWLFIFVLKDIVYRFNSAEIYSYFEIISTVYSLGGILVVGFMIGFFANYMRSVIKLISDTQWGI